MRKILGALICVFLVSLMAVPTVGQEQTPEITPTPEGTAETTMEPTLAGDADNTPAPTAVPPEEATATFSAGATEVMIPAEIQAHYRVAHFAGEAPEITMRVNDEASDIEPLAFPNFSNWETVEGGNYQFAITSADGTTVAQADANLEAGTWRTLALVPSAGDDAPMLVEVVEDYSDLNPGTGGLTVFTALEGENMVNFNRNGIPYATELTAPGVIEGGVSQLSLHDDAGLFDFAFADTQNASNVLAELPQTEVSENAYTFIALVGPASDPQVVVDLTDRAEVNIELGALQAPGTILDAAAADENLTGFAQAVAAAGLAEMLSGEGPFTVFVPANFALDTVDVSDTAALEQILRYHIVEGKLMSRGVTSAQTLETLAGEPITVRIEGNTIFVNDAQIIALNIPATNGVIHMINGVLMPTSAQQ